MQHQHPHPKERGQSLVEMAIGLVILVLLFSGMVDLGRVYFAYVALEDSAGEAAVYLSINPKCAYHWSDADCTDPNNAVFRAQNAGGGELNWENTIVTIERPTGFEIVQGEPVMNYGAGDFVTVQIQYRFHLLTPIITSIVGDNGIMLSVNATQMIISEKS